MSQPALVEILEKKFAEITFGAAVRRAVVVGQIEVIDAQIERRTQHGALCVEGRAVAKVVPKAQRQCR